MRAVLFLPTGWGHISIIGIMRRSVGRRENTTRSKKQKLFFRFARWVQRYTTIENHDKMTDEQKRKMDAFYKPSVERLEKMTGLPVRKLWDI